jgi:diadenosine tetraphosphate (Ap4A) HIT family hydrolase
MYNHAPPGYDCFVCDLVAGKEGENVVVTENEQALAIVSRRVWAKALHVHVFPRYEGDDLYRSWYRDAALDERQDFAARLQAVL